MSLRPEEPYQTSNVIQPATGPSSTQLALQKAVRHFQILVENMTDLVCLYDASGTLAYASPSLKRVLGYDAARVAGVNSYAVIHPEDLARTEAQFEKFVAQPGASALFEHRVRHADGSWRWVESSVTNLLHDPEVGLLVANIRDVTERKRAEEQQQFLLDFGEIIRPLGQVEEVLGTVARLVGQYMGVERCYFSEIDGETEQMLIYPNYTLNVASLEGAYALDDATTELLSQLKRGQTVAISDLQTHSETQAVFEQRFAPLQMRSWLAIPLRRDGEIGLLLTLHTWSAPRVWCEDEIAFLKLILERTYLSTQNARLFEQAQRVAVIEERTRMARDLHDSLVQELYGIQLGVNTALVVLNQGQPVSQVAAHLREVLLQAEGAMNELRSLIFDLRPESLQRNGLVSGLTNFVATLRTRHRLEVDSQLGAEPKVPLRIKEALYWIARQALENTVKHAQASRVTLRLYQKNGGVCLEVGDDGRGFEVAGSYPGHWGLRFMRSRAVELGGEFTLESKPGAGSQLQVCLPVSSVKVLPSRFSLTKEGFASKLAQVSYRVSGLQEKAGLGVDHPSELLAQAFEELHTALEELQTTEEELNQRNTALEDMQHALATERDRYHSLFEEAPYPYLVTDAAGVIQEANRLACETFGLNKPLIIGKPLRLFLVNSERRTFINQLSRLKSELNQAEWPVQLLSRKGTRSVATLKVTAVRNHKKTLLSLRWLLCDLARTTD